MKIHLMEPYRSAFIAESIKESLIEVIPAEAASVCQGVKTCGTPKLISETLQLAILASDISMVWTEVGSTPKEQGMPYMKVSGLEHLGVIDLIGDYPTEIALKEKTRWKDLANLNELWSFEKEEIDAFSSIILSQMEKRGKPIHWSLYRLLRAVRLGEDKAIPIILSAVPQYLTKEAKVILELKPRIMHEFELPIIMTLQELRLTLETAYKKGSKIAGTSFERIQQQNLPINQIDHIWGIVVEELVGESIQFPIPNSIKDVINLRNKNEIVDFRSFLNPFVDSVLNSDEESYKRLRRNIKQCIKAFRRFPNTKKLARWTGYASVGIGVIEAAVGFTGVSIGTGLISYGLENLAEKWKNKSSWIYLAND